MKILMPLLFLVLSASAALAGDKSVPVMYGKEKELNGCPSGGEIKAVSKSSTQAVSLRAGPGKSFAAVAKVKVGKTFAMCDSRPGWVGVVVFPNEQDRCDVDVSLDKPLPYKGKCKSGWVAEQFVHQISG